VEIYKGPWSGVQETVPSAVTVGTFDGVHLGHQKILEQLKTTADANGLRTTVVTFDPHPQEVLRSKKPEIQLLTDINEKIRMIGDIGIAWLAILDFDQTLCQLSPRVFVEEIFRKRLNAKRVIIGYDHAFGKGRGGRRDTLESMSQNLGFKVTVVEPVRCNDTVISSTKIRKALYRGDIPLANTYLGKPYSITGTVIPGDGRGHSLGMPTANIRPSHPRKLIPGDGVYAGRVQVNSQAHLAAISVGNRPTFESGDRVLEVHIIDFNDELYNKTIEVQFEQKIRDQIPFASSQDLANQMHSDVEIIKQKVLVPNQTQ
jgi:riboflavin kinase/FMN adenylyltransferase